MTVSPTRTPARRASVRDGRASLTVADPQDARLGATRVQGLRVRLFEAVGWLANRLPASVVGGAADAAGELWYRATPGRAARARANLGRVVAHLTATGMGTDRVRAAASDPAALERMVRAAYRQAARTYAEMLRAAAVIRDAPGRTRIENPDDVDAAFATHPAIFTSLHFGSLQATEAILLTRTHIPMTAPMETLDDPALQAFTSRARSATGVRLVSLEAARRELRAALARGEFAGIVGDRDIIGGGIPIPFFGAPAPLPVGPALLALESGAPIHVAAVRRLGGERFAGRLETILPPDEAYVAGPGARRARVEALLAAEAAAFERVVADAPEQWWTVFFPIWPDLAPAPRR
jgi:KDO2-lipid IV(A) lauroyltransferase